MNTNHDDDDWAPGDDGPSWADMKPANPRHRPRRDGIFNPGRYDAWVIRCGAEWRMAGRGVSQRKAFIEWCLGRPDRPDFRGAEPGKAINNVIDRLRKDGKWPPATPAEVFANVKP